MDIISILLIIFFAFSIRSMFGFGDALIAMPFLVFITGIKTAAPLMALLAFLIASGIFIKNLKHIEFKLTWKLILAALPAIPIGVFFIGRADETAIKIILGIFIILFATIKLLNSQRLKLRSKAWPYFFGFISGILGGAYNTNGPPVVMYISTQKLTPQVFRATLQSYFFFTGIGIVISHFIAGNITTEVFRLFLYNVPIILITILIGEKINKKFKVEGF